jgi:hypothetical protein
MVTVIDRDGNPVRGLNAADFRAEFRGKPVQIESAMLDTRPRRVVLVLDASGSMTDPLVWDAVKVQAADFVRRALPKLSIALIIFGSGVIETIGFDKGRGTLGARISALQKQEGTEVAPKTQRMTALFDALDSAYSLLRSPVPGDVVYIITDGSDNASHEKFSQLEDRFMSSGVRLFVLIPQGANLNGRLIPDSIIIDKFDRLIEESGGAILDLNPRAPWADHYRQIDEGKALRVGQAEQFYRAMEIGYLLSFRLPISPDKPRNWKLEIANAQGKRRKDLSVYFPRMLFPCSQPTSAPAALATPK